MDFLSATFLVFFAVSLLCYYLCPKRWQPFLLLIANYVFYFWQSPPLGCFIIIATLIVYICAIAMEHFSCKKLFLFLPMLCCFGALFAVKYLDFLLTNVLHFTGFTLQLALPLGISFYSFSLIGYVFDVYRAKIQPERNLIRFAAYASFFPSVLSGPINRARELLPQLQEKHKFEAERFKRGFLRFLIGAAKKLIVASMLGTVVDQVYAAPESYSGGMWLITVILYSLQIYIDFSSYSDMAIGTADMLGIQLMENFRAPYFSRDVKTFWKKWHISLTSWFREYLYFPLGGNRKGVWRTRINVLIVFAVSGIWHGAGWPFLIWGLLNGIYQVVGDMTSPARKRLRAKCSISENNPLLILWQGLMTFGLITLAWIFFRSGSMNEAIFIIKRILLILRDGIGTIPLMLGQRQLRILLISLLGILAEDICITTGRSLRLEKHTWRFWLTCAVLGFALLLFGRYGPGFNANDFVYFKF